jgi:hypothetical protein
MTETAQTVKDVVDTIMPYLAQAADKLGTTADYLWKLQVKQAYVEGITYGVQWIVTIVAFWILYKIFVNLNSQEVKTHDDYGRNYETTKFFACCYVYVPWGLAAIANGFFTVRLITNLKLMLTLLINPEYWALNQVILLLKGGLSL